MSPFNKSRSLFFLVFALTPILCGVLAGCGESAGASPASNSVPGALPSESGAVLAGGGDIGTSRTSPTAPFRFFAPKSFWNKPVPANALVDPRSGAVMGAFDALIASEFHQERGPWINTTSYSVPVYTVPASQPPVRVTLRGRGPALQMAWSAVPLPPDAQPAVGTDGALVVWQPSTNRLWEFWRLAKEADSWHASWGGAMQNVSSNPGVYGPEAWPGATTRWGLSSSSLSDVGGLISIEDLEKGQINHALAMAIPNVRAGVYATPAHRSDGKTDDPLALPEGAHLRLNPSLNLAALHLPRLTLILAQAAQRYGIYVKDGAGNVAFYAQDPVPTGTEPYMGTDGFFEGKYPNYLLRSFPWSSLELLKMELHATTGSKYGRHTRRHRRQRYP